MVEPPAKIRRRSVSRDILLGLCVFVAGFAVIRVSGFIGHVAGGLVGVLNPMPSRVALLGICTVSLFRLFRVGLQRNAAGVNVRLRYASLLLHAGLVLLSGSLVLSSLMRYEARFILAEGQSAADAASLARVVYAGPYASAPALELSVTRIVPSFWWNGTTLGNTRAFIASRNNTTDSTQMSTIRAWFPSLVDGWLLRLRDIGYAPLYRLTWPDGSIIDQAWALLRLFPAGTEDSFRCQFMPYTIYVRYYPNGSVPGANRKMMSGQDSMPAFRVRVADNLDLIAPSRSLMLQEKTEIGAAVLSFLDVKQWVEVDAVRDTGVVPRYAGLLFLLAAGGVVYSQTARRRTK